MVKINIEYIKEIIEKEVQSKIKNKEFPGFAITITEDGRTIYTYGAGYRNLKNLKTFNSDTLARFGSCAKVFTSLAILLLEDKGLLTIDDSITKYLNINQNEGTKAITLHHLLTHTSGIPYINLDGKGYNRNDFVKEAEKIIIKSRSDFGKCIYSNLNYSLLQIIIEKVTNKSFNVIMRDLVLDPLDMKRTLVLAFEEEVSKDNNLTVPFKSIKDENGNISFKKDNITFDEYVNGPGFLVSSCNEMINFVEMLINDGFVQGKQVFKQEIIQKLLTRYVKDEPLTKMLNVDSYNGYGIGIKDNYKGQTFINSAGAIDGGISLIGLYKEAKIGFTTIWNSLGCSQMFMYDIWDKILDDDPIFSKRITEVEAIYLE